MRLPRAPHAAGEAESARQGRSLDAIDPEAVAVEQAWADVWEQQQLREALDAIRADMEGGKAFAAFEQYVIHGQPAEAVAQKLDMHVNSVYRAKEQITGRLQQRLDAGRDED